MSKEEKTSRYTKNKTQFALKDQAEKDQIQESRQVKRRESNAAKKQENKEATLSKKRERYAAQSPEVKEAVLSKQRERNATRSPEAKEAVLSKQREWDAAQSQEVKEAVLSKKREWNAARSPEVKESLLSKQREWDTARSLEVKKVVLSKKRENGKEYYKQIQMQMRKNKDKKRRSAKRSIWKSNDVSANGWSSSENSSKSSNDSCSSDDILEDDDNNYGANDEEPKIEKSRENHGAPLDFSFEGKLYQDKLLADSILYKENLTNSIPTEICSVCNEMHGLSDMAKKTFLTSDPIFDIIFGSNERPLEYVLTELSGTVDQNPSRYLSDCLDDQRQLCKRCYQVLKKEIPTVALVNRLDWGEIPPELQDLNVLETRIISIYNCLTTFVRMSRSPGGQSGTIGGICHMVNDLSSWAKILPRHPSQCGIWNVLIQRPNVEGVYQKTYYHRVYPIRVERVKAALLWLKLHNPLYKNVEINFEFLEAWALEEDDIQVINDDDGSIPDVLKKQNENITIQHSVEEVYIETPQEDDVISGISKGLVKSKKGLNPNAKSANKTIQGLPYLAYVKPSTDEHYWEKAFPCLFPFGREGPTDRSRRFKLTESKFDQHTLLESSNRFSGSKQWIFARYKQSCSRSANSVAFVADKVGDKTPNISELYAAGRHAEAGINRKRVDTDVEKLLQKLSSFGGSMKTTHYHIRRARKHLMARLASTEMTSPTWFITLSSADLYWPELWVAIAASKGVKMSFETAAQTSFADRCKLLDENPALACRLFKSRIECMLQYIFRGEAHPIGYLVDWWFRIEFQNRGSLHVHAILWALLHYRGKWYNGDEMGLMVTNKNNPPINKNPEETTAAASDIQVD